MKRLFDIMFSFIGLIILSPLFLFICILLKIFSNESIFFIQKRVGRNSKIFDIIKFRSMISDKENKNTVSIKGDSRVTKIGSLLRKYKLDELPELYNVLKGDMSIVGPRPDVPGYADKLKGEERKILELKPGITSLSSLKYINEEEILASKKDPISYNNKVIFPDKTRINLDYYYNNNIWIDIKIIFATIYKIIF
tara:strand:- start:1370 stop:1954 length:585 start_codon:yes stop_codon:yes gene_type:complete